MTRVPSASSVVHRGPPPTKRRVGEPLAQQALGRQRATAMLEASQSETSAKAPPGEGAAHAQSSSSSSSPAATDQSTSAAPDTHRTSPIEPTGTCGRSHTISHHGCATDPARKTPPLVLQHTRRSHPIACARLALPSASTVDVHIEHVLWQAGSRLPPADLFATGSGHALPKHTHASPRVRGTLLSNSQLVRLEALAHRR